MGVELRVTFGPEAPPLWPAVAESLGGHGFTVQLRMIDGELAFPDETPPDAWRELRIGTLHGMITLRRETDGITLVTWGNADANLRQASNALAWGLAHLCGGCVRTADGDFAAEEFAKTAELPDGMR